MCIFSYNFFFKFPRFFTFLLHLIAKTHKNNMAPSSYIEQSEENQMKYISAYDNEGNLRIITALA